LISPN